MSILNLASVPFAWSATLGLVCLSLLALAAPATEPPDSKTIEGTWVPVKAELGGQLLEEAVLKTITLKLHDGLYEVSVAGHPDKGTYALETSATPKGMTVVGTDGPNRGKTFPAIYELTPGTLRICYDLSGKQRPREFKTVAGTRLYLVSYSRKNE